MATTPAAGAPASSHDRRLWIIGAAAAVVLVLVFVLHSALSGEKSAEQQIGEQVHGEAYGCVTKVSTDVRIASRWPQASKAEIIACQVSENDAYPMYVMDYAQFESPAALAAGLKTAPPDATYCTIGNAVVTLDDGFSDFLHGFEVMCANRAGALHRDPR